MKRYNKPQLKIVDISPEKVIADSFMQETTTPGNGGAAKKFLSPVESSDDEFSFTQDLSDDQ